MIDVQQGALRTFEQNAFTGRSEAVQQPGAPRGLPIGDLNHFSFVTLTTLGYGDILPVSQAARSLAALESSTGEELGPWVEELAELRNERDRIRRELRSTVPKVADFLVPEPVTSEKARGHWERNLDLTLRTVLTEDFPTGAGAQKAFNSGALNTVIYGRNEPALAFYQRSLAEAVGAPL